MFQEHENTTTHIHFISGGDFKSGFMSGVVSSAYASALGTNNLSSIKEQIGTVGTSPNYRKFNAV